jgi:hypothetical protein
MPAEGAYSWTTHATDHEHRQGGRSSNEVHDETHRIGALGVLYDARQFADEQILTCD